jgi:hypothetical protein
MKSQIDGTMFMKSQIDGTMLMKSQIDGTMLMKSQTDGTMSGVELIRHFRNTMRKRGEVKLTSLK